MEYVGESLNEKPQSKKENEMPIWKRNLIIGAVIAIPIIIIIIIVLCVVLTKKDDKEQKVLGEINCLYNVENPSKPVMLLGEEFITSNIDIYINKTKIKFSKEYKFEEAKTYEVQFKLYEEINMDYMFKDVTDLTSVIMLSNDNLGISSMKSAFENCASLDTLTINGFNSNNLKSMNKFLYKTNPSILNLNSFSTSKVEDMSFMFSETNIIIIFLKISIKKY